MSHTKIGDALFDLGPQPAGQKRYIKCGVAFASEDGRISIKLDTLPIPGQLAQWTGWINVMASKFDKPRDPGAYDPADDNIPF